MNSDGRVSREGLDELEVKLFQTLSLGGLRRSAVELVAARLGFEIEIVESFNETPCEGDPFSWLDLRYGSGKYEKTTEVENGRIAHFTRHEGKREKFDSESCKPYYFKLQTEGLTNIEIDLIGMFVPDRYRPGGSRFDAFFQMYASAAEEMARRLGLRPVFDVEITPDTSES